VFLFATEKRADNYIVYVFCLETWKANCRVLEKTIEDRSFQEYSVITGNFQIQGLLQP
jgi:hypothetical protein